MKKDIEIPVVTAIFMAIVKEYNEDFKCDDWNAYIINNSETEIEMVFIVSKGYDKSKLIETSLMRHKIEKMPAKSFAKVELLQNEVLELTNIFNVSFFKNAKLFDKKYVFEKGTVKEHNLRTIPLINKRGILVK